MKFKIFYQYLLILRYVALINCENYYSIIAPGILKSNRKYAVAVTLHGAATTCTICVSILGRFHNITDEVQVEPFQTKIIEFFLPKLEDGDYKLLSEGVKGCVFRNETVLLVQPDAGLKIYIQTDKSIYKPMDLVQFRVVILDEHTRPMDIQEPIRIEIFDTKRNRFKQFKDITLTKGVYTGKFQLDQKSAMGFWLIQVTISGKYAQEKSKQIEVQLYTSPNFSLHVKAPKYFIKEEPCFRSEVYGKYTFDKYVEGILFVELHSIFSDVFSEKQTLQTEGLTVVEFHIKDLQLLEGINYLQYRVRLEEKHTGISANYTQQITISEQPYEINVPVNEIDFLHNKPAHFQAYVKHLNNEPILNLTTPVILEHGNKKYEAFLNENGVALFEFEQEENAQYLFKYKNVVKPVPNVLLAQQNTDKENTFLKLTLKEKPQFGKPVEVTIQSSFNLRYFVYVVMGHGSIINIGHIKVPGNRKNYTLKLTPSIEMLPTSFLYVHCIHNGNLSYEEIAIQFPPQFENRISITAPKEVKPGQEITLNLIAQPKSYVSILAVDLIVNLLDSKYDLYKDDILRDLESDKSYVSSDNLVNPGVVSGLITLTNGHFPVGAHQFGSTTFSTFDTLLENRANFPETWIFQDYLINNTFTKIVLNLPKTITTWRLTAFSNNHLSGIGMLDRPTDIIAFLPFFLTLNLPHSVKRDEVIVISVTLFNYHNQSLETDITMHNEDFKFRFVEAMSKNYNSPQQTKRIIIPSAKGKMVKFSIKSLEIGELDINVTAKNSFFSDGVMKKLNVISEGRTIYENKVIYLSAEDGKSSLVLDIPLNTVKASEKVTLSVGGDYMLPVLENLSNMVNMPNDGGDQNMINFIPNILILEYIKTKEKYLKMPELVKRAKYFIDIGYEDLMSFRHNNGGYSVFREDHDKETSTWLTAFVTRYLIKASKYTAIDSQIIDSALENLAKQQLADGSFSYTGYIFYQQIQTKYGFTAFVLLTFIEDRKYGQKYETTILKAFNYISNNPEQFNNTYALSFLAVALSKFKHRSADKVIQKLQSLRKENEEGLIWWSDNRTDVLTTAYALMAQLNFPGGNNLPIVKWLIQQRNEKGDFRTTHETVVALEALVGFSQVYKTANWNMKVSYSAQDNNGNTKKGGEFFINRQNALTFQQQELPQSVRQVQFEIKGRGYTLIQLSAQYNVKSHNKNKYFSMDINTFNISEEEIDLEICFTYYAPQEAITNNYNIVIMEANLLPGYKALTNQNLLEFEFIQRIETENEDTTMILYFDKLTSEQDYCINILMSKANEVEEGKSAAVVMYEFYDKSRINIEFYSVQ